MPPSSRTLIDRFYHCICHFAIRGLPVMRSVDTMAAQHLKRNPDTIAASKSMKLHQILVCGAAGFLAGLFPIQFIPLVLPFILVIVLFLQLRMAATIAAIGGYDIQDESVQHLIFQSISHDLKIHYMKKGSIKLSGKFTIILLAEYIELGILNYAHITSLAAGIFACLIDVFSTKKVAEHAMEIFLSDALPLVDS